MSRPSIDDVGELILRELPTVRSVLVSRGRKTLLEWHRKGVDEDQRVPIFSATKSVLSMRVGMLVKRGEFPSLEASVADELPQLARSAHPSFRNIQVRHCLNMTIGYDLHFGDYDVARHVRAQPSVQPGQRFLYNDVAPQIVSKIIQARTGKSASELANATLFQALGIKDPPWPADPEGASVGGYGLRLAPKEMLAFGRFALARGVHADTEWVDRGYFRESTRQQSEGGFPGSNPYGLLWWVSGRGGRSTYYAMGYGGQLVCVCPELDLVAAIACTHELGPEVGPVQDLYFEKILPAADP